MSEFTSVCVHKCLGLGSAEWPNTSFIAWPLLSSTCLAYKAQYGGGIDVVVVCPLFLSEVRALIQDVGDLSLIPYSVEGIFIQISHRSVGTTRHWLFWGGGGHSWSFLLDAAPLALNNSMLYAQHTSTDTWCCIFSLVLCYCLWLIVW